MLRFLAKSVLKSICLFPNYLSGKLLSITGLRRKKVACLYFVEVEMNNLKMSA